MKPCCFHLVDHTIVEIMFIKCYLVSCSNQNQTLDEQVLVAVFLFFQLCDVVVELVIIHKLIQQPNYAIEK